MAFHPLTKESLLRWWVLISLEKVVENSNYWYGCFFTYFSSRSYRCHFFNSHEFYTFTAFAGGYALGEFLKIPWRQSGLISAGTGICGGSAIAAIAPVIDADHQDIAYALSATFLFDIAMVILFPLVGKAMGMSDFGFGLWTGTAVNDTSSVVAAGFSFSEAAGNYAIVVKLTRTLSIIPAILIFSYIHLKSRNKDTKQHSYSLLAIFPWFIILFLIVVLLNSLNLFSENLQISISSIGKFCMVMALGAIGLKTDFFSSYYIWL